MAYFPVQRSLTLLAVLGAFALLFLTWAKVVTTLSDARPVGTAARPSAIVWADLVFENRASLRAWLRSRGASYGAWSRRHPQQAAIIEHRPAPRPAPAKPKRQPQPTRRAAPARPGTSSRAGDGVLRAAMFTLLLMLALVLAGAAALPAPVRRRFPLLAFRVARYRGAFAAAAAAIVLGIAVGVGLS